MTKIFDSNALNILPLPSGFIVAFCKTDEEAEGKMVVAYSLVSFRNETVSPVTRSVYQLAKFGQCYKLIESQLAHAAETEQAALQLKSDYEKDLGNAKEESVRIVDKARCDAKAEYDRIVKDADAKASDIIAKANKTVEMQKQKTLQEMENEITGLALAAAAKIMNDKQDNDTALYNKFLAKLASDWNKPNGIMIITENMIPDILKPLPISKIYGLGEKSVRKLNNMGMFKIEDLYEL